MSANFQIPNFLLGWYVNNQLLPKNVRYILTVAKNISDKMQGNGTQRFSLFMNYIFNPGKLEISRQMAKWLPGCQFYYLPGLKLELKMCLVTVEVSTYLYKNYILHFFVSFFIISTVQPIQPNLCECGPNWQCYLADKSLKDSDVDNGMKV